MLWTPKLSTTSASNLFNIAASGQNVFYARFDNSSSIKFAASQDEGQSFGAESTVGTGNDVPLDHPIGIETAGAHAGRVYVVYGRQIGNSSNPPLLCLRYSDNPTATTPSWSAETILDDGTSFGNNHSYRCAVAVYNDVVVVAYVCIGVTSRGVKIARTTNGGTSWATQTLYAGNPFVSLGRPFMASEGATFHLVFVDSVVSGGSGVSYYVRSTDSGGTWPAAPTAVSASGATTGRPVVSADSGIVNVIWMQPFGVGIASNVYQARSTDDGQSWSAGAQTAATGTLGLDHPWISQYGQTCAISWKNNDTNQLEAITSTDGGASWSSRVQPFAFSGGVDIPHMAFSQNLLHCWSYDTQLEYARLPILAPAPDQTRVLDNCTRADESPLSDGGKWTNGIQGLAGGLALVSNAIAHDSSGNFRVGAWWNTLIGADNNECIVKVSALPSANTDGLDLWVRGTNMGVAATMTSYRLEIANSSGSILWSLAKRTGNATTGLGTVAANRAVAIGDYVALRVVGSELQVWHYQASAGDWQLIWTQIDTAVTTGQLLGLMFLDNQNARINSFAGGIMAPCSNSVAPAVTGTVKVGQTLSCSSGTWATANGATPQRYGYQWQSSANGSSGWADITGQTLPFFVPDSSYLTKYLRCVVTGSNTVGGVSANSNTVGPVTDVTAPVCGTLPHIVLRGPVLDSGALLVCDNYGDWAP